MQREASRYDAEQVLYPDVGALPPVLDRPLHSSVKIVFVGFLYVLVRFRA